MRPFEQAEVELLCLRLEPRLRAGYRVEAEPADELWELRFELHGLRHRLKLDPLYIEDCLDRGDCGHLQELLDEVCHFLEGR